MSWPGMFAKSLQLKLHICILFMAMSQGCLIFKHYHISHNFDFIFSKRSSSSRGKYISFGGQKRHLHWLCGGDFYCNLSASHWTSFTSYKIKVSPLYGDLGPAVLSTLFTLFSSRRSQILLLVPAVY